MSSFFANLETEYDRSYSDLVLLKRYGGYIKEHKKHLLTTVIAILAGALFTLFIPFTLQRGVDGLIENKNQVLVLSALMFFILYVFVWIFDFIRQYENTRFTALSTQTLRHDLFTRVQKHDQAFFDKNNSGMLQSRIMDDTQAIADFVRLTSDFFVNVLIAIGTAIILFYLDFYLSLLAFAVIPFLIIVTWIFRKIARNLSRDWRISISKLNDSFSENISGISVVRSFARENTSYAEFDRLNQLNRKINTKKQMFFSSIFPVIFASSSVGLFLVLYSGGISSINTGDPSPGTLLLYVVLLQRFYFPIVLITTYAQQVQAGLAAAERIFSLMDVESSVKDDGTLKVPEDVRGKIVISNLNFAYDDGTVVYRDFNLNINPGETVAIVGHTGAGKSTLISLLTRFYDYKGVISLDDINIKEYTLRSYRGSLGVVLQEPFIFSGTIRENIAYGRKDASEKEIVEAAKMANSWEFINTMKDKLDTNVLEEGKRLSQGQKQLITLSRAFLINPKILLFDEATASIDSYSETLIQEAINRLLSHRTAIIIAHRLTTIKQVDRIIVLQDGQIVEQGAHHELLQSRGHYAELYEKYFEFQEVNV